MKITGILIPEDVDEPMERVKFDRGDIKKMQGYIGGNFAVTDLERPASSLWYGDESKLVDGWQINRRATNLLWIGNSAFYRYDVIAGDAILTGPPDKSGNTTSVPDELITLLFEAYSYRVEFQFNGEDDWKDTPDRFGDWEMACLFAIRLRGLFPETEHVQVLPA